MRAGILVLAFAATAWCAQEPPAWFTRLRALAGMEATFRQQGESAVFKAIEKRGRLQVAKGGRLRVAYDRGALLVADGRTLVHYEPLARTAQRIDLRGALREAPLLALLVDPSSLEETYRIEVAGNQVVLVPRNPGPPRLGLTGSGDTLQSLRWTDRTGARQTLTLERPVMKIQFPEATFRFQEPKGTRWVK